MAVSESADMMEAGYQSVLGLSILSAYLFRVSLKNGLHSPFLLCKKQGGLLKIRNLRPLPTFDTAVRENQSKHASVINTLSNQQSTKSKKSDESDAISFQSRDVIRFGCVRYERTG